MYIGLPSLGLRSSSAGFSPASLFAAGEQGGWYDPSDISTMWQDSVGTTPAVLESPVGLLLDKRLGLVRGPELVSNGSAGFATTTGWTPFSGNTTVSAVGGALRVNIAVGVAGDAYTSFTTVIGKSYEILYTVSGITATTVKMIVGTSGGSGATASDTPSATLGSRRLIFVASATTMFITLETAGSVGQTADVSVVSCKLVDGNHLIQATAASRPTLSARYNKLTKTEQFDVAPWLKADGTSVVTPNSVIAPDGTLTGDTVTLPSANAYMYQQSIAGTAAGTYTASAYVKGSGGGTVVIILYDGTNSFVSGQFTLTANWQRITWTATIGAAVNQVGFGRVTASGASATTMDIWGADLRTGADATLSIPAYQRVDTATSYDTSGFPMYLSHDGVDDWTKSSVPLGWGTPTLFWSIGACLTSLPAASTFWDTTRYSSRALVGAIRFTTSGAKDYDDAGYGLVAGTNTVVGGVYDATFGFTPRKNAVPRTLITGTVDGAVGETFFSLYAGNAVGNPLPGRLYQFIMRKAVTDAATMALVDKFVGIKSGLSL